jgi:hypothetical protein
MESFDDLCLAYENINCRDALQFSNFCEKYDPSWCTYTLLDDETFFGYAAIHEIKVRPTGIDTLAKFETFLSAYMGHVQKLEWEHDSFGIVVAWKSGRFFPTSHTSTCEGNDLANIRLWMLAVQIIMDVRYQLMEAGACFSQLKYIAFHYYNLNDINRYPYV